MGNALAMKRGTEIQNHANGAKNTYSAWSIVIFPMNSFNSSFSGELAGVEAFSIPAMSIAAS